MPSNGSWIFIFRTFEAQSGRLIMPASVRSEEPEQESGRVVPWRKDAANTSVVFSAR